jgi:acetyl esterase/lipase
LPVGYLISILLLLGPTTLAIAPMTRSWTLRQISWRLGFQIGELPIPAAIWVLFWTAFAGLEGDLATPGGLAVVALAILELAGLALLVRRSLRARTVVADALHEAFENGRSSRRSLDIEHPTGHRPSARSVFVPLAVRRRDVVRTRNLAYGSVRPDQLLDLYRPRSTAGDGPCLAYFHGGGYRTGRKSREARALIYRLASAGWLCVSANYRLPPSSPYPASLIDAKAVIAWVREHAGRLGGDPATVFVAGSSAGAHLAAMAALTTNDPSLQPGFESADTSVAGAICLYGFYGTPTWIEVEAGAPSSPLEHVASAAPPLFVAHGDLDTFVPVAGARRFVERLRAISTSPVVYAELPGAQHTFDLYHSIRFESVVDGIAIFTAAVDEDRRPRPRPRKRIDGRRTER